MNITRAALGPFSTGPSILLVIVPDATSRMYQNGDESSVSLAISNADRTMDGPNRMNMKVRIDEELDFFNNALKRMAIPVSANMYTAQ